MKFNNFKLLGEEYSNEHGLFDFTAPKRAMVPNFQGKYNIVKTPELKIKKKKKK